MLSWNSAHWQLQDGSAGPATPSSGIGYYSSWWIHLGDLLLECKALRSGQMENALHGAWHTVSPRNECVLRYVHRQWDKVVPLSASCCWNFLLKTRVCSSNGYLQWNIGVSCICYMLRFNKLKSQLCSYLVSRVFSSLSPVFLDSDHSLQSETSPSKETFPMGSSLVPFHSFSSPFGVPLHKTPTTKSGPHASRPPPRPPPTSQGKEQSPVQLTSAVMGICKFLCVL